MRLRRPAERSGLVLALLLLSCGSTGVTEGAETGHMIPMLKIERDSQLETKESLHPSADKLAEEGAEGEGVYQLIVCPHGPQAYRNSEGDLIQLSSGRLLLVWSEFYGGFGDAAAARISGKVSDDGGKTWSNSFTVVEAPSYGRNVMSPSLIRSKDGELLLFYLWKISSSDCRVMLRRSSDEGQTWGEPLQVSSLPGYHVLNNARVISLRETGRLLVPVALNNQSLFCYISDDGGRSWRRGRGDTTIPGNAVMEPGLVELRDGKVMMIIRTRLGRIYKAYSYDGGETWTVPEPMELVSPDSPATITRLPSTGDLLIVWNNQPLGAKAAWSDRTPLTCAISQDEGETWGRFKNIEDDPNCCFAYTSITFIGGKAYLTYYSWRKGVRNFENTDLKLTVVPESWFYKP